MQLFSFVLGVSVRGCMMEISRTAESRNAGSWKMPLTITGTQVSSGGSCELQSFGCITDLLAHLELFGTGSPAVLECVAQLELGLLWGSSTGCPEAVCIFLERLQAILNTGFRAQRNLTALWSQTGCLEGNEIMQM